MTTTASPPGRARPRRRITSLEVLCALLVAAVVFQAPLASVLDVPALRTGSTVFVAVCVQAMPFLVLGVLISGLIAAFVPPEALRRMLPSHAAAAVPVAGVAGLALPGCECASVPVARRLMQQGVAPAAALAFLLAAPAVNPIVLVSTAVAFPAEPLMVLARFLGSLLTACVMGWLWVRVGKAEWIAERALRRMEHGVEGGRWAVFTETARHDLVEAGGFLVLGGLTSAVFNVVVPAEWMQSLGGQLVLGVLVMAVLAVVLALCSEADAFVAASLSGLPLIPKLVFLVVGPAVDLKLIALQSGTFGRRFAARFAPATFVVAVACSVAVGALLLGGA
ncbi:permease [Saccharopolyspora taberi]|uniref:Permease n=1 Tax=Saccharopolyspora taberi TaxID=60895 RepID=A0ABN3V3Z2_9PSEU